MRLTELRLMTNKLTEQRQFYQGTLGLPVADTAPNQIAIQMGTTKVVFEATATPLQGAYHFAINIPENQFAEAKAWLMARTPLATNSQGTDEYNFVNWNAHAVYCYDPARNIVEFIARHGLPNQSDAPFGVAGWLGVSEIGVPTDDVRATVKAMQDSLGVVIYDGEGSDTFTAVGDEQGLFIVVKRGRIWYPETGLLADLDPLTVVGAVDAEKNFVLTSPPLLIQP